MGRMLMRLLAPILIGKVMKMVRHKMSGSSRRRDDRDDTHEQYSDNEL